MSCGTRPIRLPHRADVCRQALAEDRRVAKRRRQQRRQHRQRRGLPRAVGTEQADRLSDIDGEGDSTHGLDGTDSAGRDCAPRDRASAPPPRAQRAHPQARARGLLTAQGSDGRHCCRGDSQAPDPTLGLERRAHGHHVSPARKPREAAQGMPFPHLAYAVGDTDRDVLHDAGVAEAVDHAACVQPSRTYCDSSSSNTEPIGSCQLWHRHTLSSQSR